MSQDHTPSNYNSDTACGMHARGLTAKARINAMPSGELARHLLSLDRNLREIEGSVLGADSVDKLRYVRGQLQNFMGGA